MFTDNPKGDQPFMTQMNERYSAALKRYGGFQGPFWGLDDEEEK